MNNDLILRGGANTKSTPNTITTEQYKAVLDELDDVKERNEVLELQVSLLLRHSFDEMYELYGALIERCGKPTKKKK